MSGLGQLAQLPILAVLLPPGSLPDRLSHAAAMVGPADPEQAPDLCHLSEQLFGGEVRPTPSMAHIQRTEPSAN
jgi:hypothetical protein